MARVTKVVKAGDKETRVTRVFYNNAFEEDFPNHNQAKNPYAWIQIFSLSVPINKNTIFGWKLLNSHRYGVRYDRN